MRRALVLAALAVPTVARAAPPAIAVVTGTAIQVAPVEPGCGCDVLTAVAHAIDVQVASATDKPTPFAAGTLGGALPDGAVRVVHPLLGMAVPGTLAKGHVALPAFVIDRRANADAVLVVAGAATVAFLEPTAADVAAIRAAVARAPALEGVKKAAAKLEVGVVDLDGDGKPDVASTYGCTVWGDGNCQVSGQFLLVRAAAGWKVLE